MRWSYMLIPALLVGCSSNETEPLNPALPPPVDEASLHVEVTALVKTARPRDAVIARITNHSAEVVYENLCAGWLEGFGYVPGEWNGSFGYGRACAYTGGEERAPGLRPIDPGKSVVDTFFVNDMAYAGQWRFNFDLRDRDGDLLPMDRRVSQAFTVIR
jgi:hypothetical protein